MKVDKILTREDHFTNFLRMTKIKKQMKMNYTATMKFHPKYVN